MAKVIATKSQFLDMLLDAHRRSALPRNRPLENASTAKLLTQYIDDAYKLCSCKECIARLEIHFDEILRRMVEWEKWKAERVNANESS